MGKLRMWSVVLLGMSIAGVSGLSLARTPPGGPGGYGKPAPTAGSYSKPLPAAPRPGGAGPVRVDSFHKPPPPDYRGDYHRPPGDYHRPPGDYHRPPGDYHRPAGGYYHPGWHDNDDWYFSLYLSPFYWPWYYSSPYYYPGPYYYPPYYYPPGVMTVPATPQEYIERDGGDGTAPPPSAYWYYCSNPRGYYPDVQQCNVDWRPVAPRPPEAPTDGRSP